MVEYSVVNRVVVSSSPARGVWEAREACWAEESEAAGRAWIRRGFKGKRQTGLLGQAVKTSPFHGGNTGSIPVGVIFL